MRRITTLLAAALVALALAAPAMAQDASGCKPNPAVEGGEICRGLTNEEATQLAGQGYSCDLADNGAVCAGIPASASASASAAAEPCNGGPVRETPDGLQCSNLPDVSASASASASAPAEDTAAAGQYRVPAPTTGITELPATGGASLLALGAGVLLVAGGLVARRIVR
jgi:hypothetical protein